MHCSDNMLIVGLFPLEEFLPLNFVKWESDTRLFSPPCFVDCHTVVFSQVKSEPLWSYFVVWEMYMLYSVLLIKATEQWCFSPTFKALWLQEGTWRSKGFHLPWGWETAALPQGFVGRAACHRLIRDRTDWDDILGGASNAFQSSADGTMHCWDYC